MGNNTKRIRFMNLYLYSAEGTDSAANKWDYGLLKEFCEKKGINQINVKSLPQENKAFVAIPAPSNAGLEHIINNEIKKIKKVILFIMGDEAALFNLDYINHPNISIWVQYPHDKHQRYNKFPQGTPQHFKQNIPPYTNKEQDLYFSGQVNHNRRKQLSNILPVIPNSTYNFTEGFTKGDKPDIYYKNMIKSKFIPCPSGIVVLDSFRFYEALELLCYPILDSVTPKDEKPNYFGPLFNQTMPIISVNSWEDLPNLMVNLSSNYPHNMHKAVSWWIKFKRDLFNTLMEDINEKA
jgi:hypothetical protein